MKRFALTLLVSLSATAAVLAEDWPDAGGDSWGGGFDAGVEDAWVDSWDEPENKSPWTYRSFIDAGVGVFAHDNSVESAQSLSELRVGLSVERYWDEVFFRGKFEFIADDVEEKLLLDARELYLESPLGDAWVIKAGQQVLTWGTGDFVFLNDYFPKDWQAMLSGRDDDYLKAPSASIKLGYFSTNIGVDLVVTPEFAPDNFIDGERFSYYRPGQGIVAAPPRVRVDEPSATVNNAQYFSRLYKTHNGVEYAGYFYRGFFTQPLGFDPVANKNTFPRLKAWGFSFRTPWAGGIANMEWVYQDSVDDDKGDNPLVPNSNIQWLTGFEREVVRNLTVAGQVLLKWTLDYDAQQQAAPLPDETEDELHTLLTTRITHMAMQQKLTSSLFVFYSPDANDWYLKPKVGWRHSDHWYYELGANLFGGPDEYTQWAQFEDNSNLYFRVKYSF